MGLTQVFIYSSIAQQMFQRGLATPQGILQRGLESGQLLLNRDTLALNPFIDVQILLANMLRRFTFQHLLLRFHLD